MQEVFYAALFNHSGINASSLAVKTPAIVPRSLGLSLLDHMQSLSLLDHIQQPPPCGSDVYDVA